MKTKYYLSVLLIILSYNSAVYAQKEVCGSDTIIFDLSNYQMGTVQWQESMDGEHWNDILNANDLVFKYYTKEEKHIRALITLSTCEQIISEEAFIRQLPEANAGIDQKISNTRALLTGNYVSGATGNWKLLGDNGGVLAEQDSLTAVLEGKVGNAYKLVWTNTNACGSSSDTVSIELVDVDINNNFVIVDTTDIITSDSTDLAKGIYKIEFSDKISNINDSSFLVGIMGEGFLRKVLSFQKNNDTSYIFKTEQGYLEDICNYGVLNLGDNIISTGDDLKSSSNITKLNHRLTRKEIKNNADYNRGIHVFQFKEILYKDDILKSVKTDEKSILVVMQNEISLEQGNLTISFGLDGSLKFTPNFIFNPEIKWFHLKHLKAGFDNARIENKLKFYINGNIGGDLKKPFKKNLFKKTDYKLIIVSGLPILVVSNLLLDFETKYYGEGECELDLNYDKKNNFTAYLEYYEGQKPKGVCEKSKDSYFYSSVYVDGKIGLTTKIEPRVNMKVWGILGPFFSLPIKVNPELCGRLSNDYNLAWDANVSVGMDVNIGCEVGISKNINYSIAYTSELFSTGIKIPYNIKLIEGNNQYGTKGKALDLPLKVRVTSNLGFGVPLVPVSFDVVSGDGILDKSIVLTDLKGYAENSLTLGADEKTQVRVYAENCDNENLNGGPLLFSSYNKSLGNEYSCSNSSLNLKTFIKDNMVTAKGVLGVKPYKYSTDGYNFINEAPRLSTSEAINTTFYVKDARGCIATSNYKHIDVCEKSKLSVDVKFMGNSIEAIAKNGVSPYSYSLYKDKYFSTQAVFNSLNPGDYSVYVKDASGCKSNSSFSIKEPISHVNYGTLTDVDGNIYETSKIGDQIWMSENLHTIKLNDGTPIPMVPDKSYWANLATPAYCWYDNNRSNNSDYGILYNWYSLNTGKLCPKGWHIPSDDEWKKLIQYLGGDQVAGGKLKEIGYSHWNSPNTSASNETGFSALPGGSRDYDGKFGNKGLYGYWWSSTLDASNTSDAWVRKIFYNTSEVKRVNGNKKDGLSVRCIKDEVISSGGCFSDNFNDGDFTNDVAWKVINKDDIPGIVSIVNKDYVRFYRTNAPGNGGGVYLLYRVNTNIDQTTSIKFDVNPVFSDVGDGAGWKDGEYPINVYLFLSDANKNTLRLRFCYNYRGGASLNSSDYIRVAFPYCEQNVWLRNQQFVIKDYFPQAVRLDSIEIGGNGWDFEGYIDNIELLNCDGESTGENSDPIAYFPFNGNANDESGNGYNATVTGPVLTSDRFSNANSAYLFDGDKDYIQMETKLPVTSFPFSISTWIKPFSFSTDGANYIYVSDDWDHYWGSYKGFSVILRNDGSISAGYAATVNTSVNFFRTEPNVIELNKWYHVVVVFKNPGDVSVFINNSKIAVTESSPDNHNVNFSTTKDRIGYGYDGINRHSFDGIIDDVRFYKDALTNDVISSLYYENGWNVGDEEAPVVNLTYPESDLTINTNGIRLEGEAYDNDGEVVSVKIKVNDGEWMDVEDNVSSWTKWIWIDEGNNKIYVKAIDNDNNESEIKSIQIVTHPDVIYYKDFGITTYYYEYDSNWDDIVSSLTDGYRVGDWNDLVYFYNTGGDLLDLFDGLGLKDYNSSADLKRNGEQFYSSDRSYYASRHEHNKPSNYLAHDNIDNYLISLGSWYNHRRIFLFKIK